MTSELQGPQYHLGNGAFRSREEKKQSIRWCATLLCFHLHGSRQGESLSKVMTQTPLSGQGRCTYMNHPKIMSYFVMHCLTYS